MPPPQKHLKKKLLLRKPQPKIHQPKIRQPKIHQPKRQRRKSNIFAFKGSDDRYHVFI
jgi:hypothetical protein